MTLDMQEAVSHQGFDQTGIDMLGHSNGSIVVAWIIKSMPNLIKRVGFVDPVCFCECPV